MKNFVLLSILFIFGFVSVVLCQSIDHNKNNDLKYYGLLGQVKSFSEHSYLLKDSLGKLVNKGEKNDKYLYVLFYQNGKKKDKYWNKTSGDLFERYHYVYDNKNKLIAETIYDSLNMLEFKIIYRYNRNARKNLENIYRKNGKIEYSIHFMYDSLDYTKLTGEIWYNSKNDIVQRHKYIYRKDNSSKLDRISTTKYSCISSMYNTKYDIYDSKGHKIRSIISDCNNKSKGFTIEYHYDDKGHKSYQVHYNSAGKIIKTYKYRYSFDDIGNWISKRVVINGFSSFVVKRTIEYY